MSNLLLGGSFLFLLGDVIFVWLVNRSNEQRINETMEKGTRPQLIVSDNEYVFRSKDIEYLKTIFQPIKDHSSYHVICGKYGTGKTTLLKKMANEVGKGVIYINFPANFNDLGDEFGKALNLTFEEDISLTVKLFQKFFGWYKDNEGSSYSKWQRAMYTIKRASKVYKANNEGRSPVIVYDNFDQIIDQKPEIFDILQDDAKRNADDRQYIAVFVSSKDSVLKRMESNRSSWSRVRLPVEIGNLNEKESMEYLIKKNINEVEAKKLYELVGGHVLELKSVADHFLAGKSFKVIKQQILTQVKKNFASAKLLQNQTHHEAGKSIINILLNSKEINNNVFKEFFKEEEYDEVIKANVFAYHPSKHTVTFQSQSVEVFIQENPNIFAK